MTTKQTRLALIKARWNRNSRFFVAALAVANTIAAKSTSDEKDTARRSRALTSERATAMNDSIADVDNVEITTSRLVTVTDDTMAEDDSNSLSSYLLTPMERKMLNREWHRKPRVVEVAPVNPDDLLPAGFAPQVSEPFVSVFDGIVEPNGFELDMADRILELMPAPRILLLTA